VVVFPRVFCARTAVQSGSVLRCLGWDKAKTAPKRRPSAAKNIIRAEVPKDPGPRLVAEMLTSLHGRMSPACELGEVLAAVAMERGQSPELSPTDADVVQGLGSYPLFQCSLADGKQRGTAALMLGAHDTHAL
jgi:hypothetical protein